MDKQLIKNRVCLITGANRGIGKAIATSLDQFGAKLILHGRDKAGLESLRASLTFADQHDILVADLSHVSEIEKMSAIIDTNYQKLDILINNAGVLGPRMPLEHYPVQTWDEVLAINLKAPFLLTQKLIPKLKKGNKASVVFVTSGVGRRGPAEWGAYSVSKFGIESITQVYAIELARHHIRVNAVNPGGTRTDMRAAAFPEEDPSSLPSPEQITPLFVYLTRPDITLTGQSLEAQDWIGKDPLAEDVTM